MSSKTNTNKFLIIALVVIISMSGTANADFTFGTPTNLGPIVNSSSGESVTCFSSDGLEMYFDAQRSGGYGSWDIWVARRPTMDDDWGIPENLGPPVNSSVLDGFSHISADGLSLFFESKRTGGVGGGDIWVAKRATRNDAWGMPVNLGTPVNTGGSDSAPRLSADGLELYYGSSSGYGAHDIWVSRRATKNDPWMPPVNLGAVVNSSANEFCPFVSADGLSLFFESNRPGGFGGSDMWITTRASVSEPWGVPVNLGPIVNTSSRDTGPVISPDGFMLYFSSERPGGLGGPYGDIWQAPILPVVDLNSDGFVDILDMRVMVDYWGEDYSLCDIGPTPFGDGIVDVQDLSVLVEHLLEDYPLVAHWKLDEADGDIAYDSIGDHDGTINGNPFWQPTGGMIGGSLMLDGMDDYVDTPFVLNPSNGSLSAFTWIKGGAPGQVIISQTGDFGGTWLGINPSEGKLMTGFSDIYFGALVSETVITDVQWHHVGFVYDLDTLHRRLYVDGVLVAEDATVVSGVPSDGGLYIGASKDLDATSFFSGFIDDVRIYNQALSTKEIATLAQ